MPDEKRRKVDIGEFDAKDRELLSGLLKSSDMMSQSSDKELDSKLRDLQELEFQNNQLLGFLIQTLNPMGESLESMPIPLSEDLWEELCKYHVENSKWGMT